MATVVLGTEQGCEDFVRGLNFMGTGGGGDPKVGLRLLLDQVERGRQFEWVDADSLPEGACTIMVALMGGRARGGGTEEERARLGLVKEKYGHLELMVASVRELEASAGVEVEVIVPGEIGASNVPVPIAAARELGLPVIDGDYAGGRAIPEVNQTIPEVMGVPAHPCSFVDRWGNVMILKEVVSTEMADRIGRMITLASYGWIGFACYLMPVKEAKNLIMPGSLTQSLRVGRAIREAREKGTDPVETIIETVEGWLLFQGEITAVETADEQAFAFGVGSHTLRGVGDYEGHTFQLWYKNEFHISWLDGEPFVTSPDAIAVVLLESGEPKRSFDFAEGDKVAVIGRKAAEAHRTKKGIEVLGPRHFGFDFNYVPIEQRVTMNPR